MLKKSVTGTSKLMSNLYFLITKGTGSARKLFVAINNVKLNHLVHNALSDPSSADTYFNIRFKLVFHSSSSSFKAFFMSLTAPREDLDTRILYSVGRMA